MIVSIQSYLKSDNRNLIFINNKLLNFINFSKNFSYGKNKLLIGIYDTTNLVQSSLNNDKEFGIFEKTFSEVVALDPTLYEARTWYAKSLYANNKIDEAFAQVDKAINLSSLGSSPYRLAIKMAIEQKNFELKNSYCSKYLASKLGGTQKRYTSTIHSGFNINKFGISLKPDNEDIFTFTGVDLEKLSTYEIIPDKSKDIDSIDIYFTFMPGTLLEIKRLILQSDQKTITIEQRDLSITAKYAFFLNTKLRNSIIFTEVNDEIINLDLKQNYKKIDKVSIEMMIKKLDLTNLNCPNISK